MDHRTGKIEHALSDMVTLRSLAALACLAFLSIGIVNAQVYSSSGSVTITACVDDGAGSCNPVVTATSTGSTGGGGGGGASSPAVVPSDLTASSDSAVFKGTAYPGSIVTILKNGVIAAETPASPDGSFQVTLRNLKGGTYTFGVLAEDSMRLKSTLNLYTVYIANNVSTQVEGIFLPPTITSDKIEVKRGDPIILQGSSAPGAQITILVHSSTELTKKVSSTASGAWIYKLDSLELEYGDHEAKTRAATESDLSLFSPALSFTVGTLNKVRDTTVSALPSVKLKNKNCDLNADSKVNLLDFSIIAFWYKRIGFPQKVDLNNDNRIDLSDVSILAYCWTG